MIVKVDLELGVTPVAAARCEGIDGRPARIIEEAMRRLNAQTQGLSQFKMYGRKTPAGRRPEIYGKQVHEDGFVQMIVEARNLSAACDLAVGLLISMSA